MKKEVVIPVVFSWLAMVATDLLLHGGILAWLYQQDSPFLLDPLTAFERIPLGYISFLLLAILLHWFMRREQELNLSRGFRTGIKLGALVWLSLTLGLYSITTAGVDLLLGWFIGQTLELGIGGFAMVMCMKSENLKRLFFYLLLYFLLILVIVVILQSAGLAPAMKWND